MLSIAILCVITIAFNMQKILPWSELRHIIVGNADKFADIDEIKEYAAGIVKTWEIGGICDAEPDDYTEIDDWVQTNDFIAWLAPVYDEMPDWLQKACLIEVLKKR